MDFDGDGRTDIISGSYMPGDLFVFKRLSDGAFAEGEEIRDVDGDPVNVGDASAVFAVDWDQDGDLDLVVGNIEGGVWYVPNLGTRTEAKFDRPYPVTAAGKELHVAHGDAGPAVADWDGDGLLDLLVGAGDGSVQWCRNTGTKQQFVLAEPRTLVPPNQRIWDSAADRCGTRTKVCVTDWNGDGLADLLVGDFVSGGYSADEAAEQTEEETAAAKKLNEEYQAALQRYREASTRTEVAEKQKQVIKLYQEREELKRFAKHETREAYRERKQKLAEVNEQLSAIQQAMQRELEPIMKELREISSRRRGPSRREMHGWVWLFERKLPKLASQ